MAPFKMAVELEKYLKKMLSKQNDAKNYSPWDT